MIFSNEHTKDNIPSLEEAIAKIIDSVAEEELALARLISSETVKIHAFVGEENNFPTSPSNEEIIKFNYSVQRIIDSVMMKEWLLFKKIELVQTLVDKINAKMKHFYPDESSMELDEE